MNHTITPLTLELVANMATDPRSTPALRAFHKEQLAGLRARAVRQQAPAKPNPFDRFIERLKP